MTARLITYEESPWDPTTIQALAKRFLIHVSRQHVEEGRWTRFADPVSLALQVHLSDRSCAEVFWNSDGFGPRYPGDDARIGIHHEVSDPDTETFVTENHYHLPLPRRATQAMWKLRRHGIHSFQPFTMAVYIPQEALA